MIRRTALKTMTAGAASVATMATAAAYQPQKSTEILMLVYPQFTALDLVGPHHVLRSLGRYKVKLVAKSTKPVTSDTGLTITPELALKDCPEAPAVLFIPGGTMGTIQAMEDQETREFVASRGAKSQYVTSVCTGSFVLAAAGLLKGYKATTHWLALESLKLFGAEPVSERVVVDRNRITGAGVTAGIDFGLALASKLMDESYAKAVQLMMEYDPQPPFHNGSPKTADKDSITMLRAMTKPFQTQLTTTAKRLAKTN
ncbi:MAG: DJ-1/PfpI family protein [Gemmataceae bacterium]